MEDPKMLAYKAMYKFLDEYYKRGKSEDIAVLLSNLSLLDDGMSADPAMMEDWNDAYSNALNSTDDDYGLKFIE